MSIKPSYRFALIDSRYTVSGDGLIDIVDSWDGVERWWRQRKSQTEILIGYIGYEQGYKFIEAPRNSILWQKKPDSLTMPPVYFGRFRRTVRQRTKPPAVTKQALLKNSQLINQRSYQNMFATVQRHLRAGDIYQANIAARLNGLATTTPIESFWQIFGRQPVSYGAYIQTPEFSIASGSPELFLRIQGASIETRPMKGTCPRGQTRAQDDKLKQDLLHSIKEQAELDMIIDVHRNDLAKTCKPGSVRVIRRREFVPFTTVWQAQARISAERQRQFSPLDTITTCFPAGSVTGAPKLRAMEIIHELEPVPRQVYCGAIGYIKATGDAEFNVAIRTAILKNQQLYYYAGGGITIGSTATAEWQELLNKKTVITTNE
ncbi:MAG: hypothetical protein ACD_43C00226G0004 [uncultured bacterium]|nr:MAG: hypothetical protein ACD_43C00226G0004 [uncultured bacterium]